MNPVKLEHLNNVIVFFVCLRRLSSFFITDFTESFSFKCHQNLLEVSAAVDVKSDLISNRSIKPRVFGPDLSDTVLHLPGST